MSALQIKNTSESDPRSYEVTWAVTNKAQKIIAYEVTFTCNNNNINNNNNNNNDIDIKMQEQKHNNNKNSSKSKRKTITARLHMKCWPLLNIN